MTRKRSVPVGKLSFTHGKAELHRQLREQFYENSVGRYDIDSEQVRVLSRLLIPAIAELHCMDLAVLNSTE
jgi:hypothetical protein